MARPNDLARPGSWRRVWWLYLSSAASLWLLWAVGVLATDLADSHSSDEYWDLWLYLTVTLGGLLAFVFNAVFLLPVAWLIDGVAKRSWPWYLAIGLVPGVLLAASLWNTREYAWQAGLIVVIGGYVLGPLVAQRAFRSRGWRVAVTVATLIALASLVLVLLL